MALADSARSRSLRRVVCGNFNTLRESDQKLPVSICDLGAHPSRVHAKIDEGWHAYDGRDLAAGRVLARSDECCSGDCTCLLERNSEAC